MVTNAPPSATTHASAAPLSTWTESQGAAATYTPVIAEHRLADLDVFGNAHIAEIIERQPPSLLEIFAPVTGNRAQAGWRPVAPGGASGAEILAAVERGRLWVLAPRVHETDPTFAKVRDLLADELGRVISGFATDTMTLTLLVSSPTATVPYHLDGIPNLLWHIRGRKRIHLYPPDLDAFVDPRLVEDIVVGESPEYLPYDDVYESAALTLDLEPGQVLAIPHYAPHRVDNVSGLNVSLNSELSTLRTERRNAVRAANRYFSRRLHLPIHSTQSEGMLPSAKRAAYRMLRRFGLDSDHRRPPTQVPLLEIDPSAPEGFRPVDNG